MRSIQTLLFAAFLGVALSVEADEGGGHVESHGAHVHGRALLHIVMENDIVHLELHSPAMNLVGFEHSAGTAGQRKAVDHAKKQLAAAAELFSFEGARCNPTETNLDFSAVLAGPEHQGAHHHHGHDQHGDIVAQYRYQCEKPDLPDALSTELFDFFPGVEALEAQWIVNGRQGFAMLDKNNTRLVFR